ncbi:hypothetical protein ABE137_08810 [Brevibacillus laterosporus]|uniref:Cyclic lactone autoinducer peptide n=1 Tax=Brevibacillus halotolerans TaxID=1507437 RepID=A0ABT4HR71_9BACL|nr:MULTISPECIES: hypothetical protein [Brevibacillus]MCR8983568.1 hypothetical protein [Brevibacillus laterosporus]MCZ0829286.1 hypothetical protein [Brevibacillus halotolerans]
MKKLIAEITSVMLTAVARAFAVSFKASIGSPVMPEELKKQSEAK